MMSSIGLLRRLGIVSGVSVALWVGGVSAAPKSFDDLDGGVIAVLGCGEAGAPGVAAGLGKSGNSVVHAIAGSVQELAAFNTAIAAAGVKGVVLAEQLGLAALPYRDGLVNTLVIMDTDGAKAAGLSMEEARRCVAPFGMLVTCRKGRITGAETIPLSEEMDVWTHRYYRADGIPASSDKVFDLPVGFKWNAGLPMNFDNPVRAANRYSSTRAMVVDDGRCFTFSEVVYENLGQGWKSEYGTEQALTCRDAFNGRFLWRRCVGETYYGGLYIENMAPMVSTGKRIYLAGENGKMLAINTRTGKTERELPTAYIPGLIAASGGTVVAATWKDGKSMGSVKRYDRRRMDWAIDTGTIEAYDDESGKLLWKQELLGTSLLIAEGRVLIVNRSAGDPIEANHGKPAKAVKPKSPSEEPPVAPDRPGNRVMALDLAKGRVLWESEDQEIEVARQRISLEAAASGAVAVAFGGRNQVKLLSAETGKLLDAEARKLADKYFFRYRNHICTPVFHVNDIRLENRGGRIVKGNTPYNYGGARAACLTGTLPAYGAGYIAQNWCNCSPGQIPGLLAIAPIGQEPEPAAMEGAASPIVSSRYDDQADGVARDAEWQTFRGNAHRSSSAACDVATNVTVAWSRKVVSGTPQGTVKREWLDYLNSRITAAALSADLAVVGDIDHNEVIALRRSDGTVAWRSPVSGRMNTAPTVCKGICLVGDHGGYVSALELKTGEFIYRLRIAPEERRMVSYGKVESVWPVIGGVLVADGKAYASAGRTQGSDGGLVVRAFVPATGEAIWARALPQKGNGVIEARPRRNDALFMENGAIRIMDHRLDPGSGAIVGSPVQAAIAEAQKTKESELGRSLNGKEKRELEGSVRKAASAREVSMGNEGIHSWNWTRLGHRKFQQIGYAGLKGDALCWDGRYVACSSSRNGRLSVKSLEGSGGGNYALAKGCQATSLVMCGNAVVVGGAIIDQGGDKGFVSAVSIEDGKELWKHMFAQELAFNGLAVDGGEIVVSLADGSVAVLK
jgi:outer membrane protein assembly factor BamB